ncbi:hypothetical protein [Streptosporangium sp. NPDC049644]|uniref:hypothetical protein n=1 Tax=Streptosporangium sp. NPDC049644 TaxID=3155507 RepID=UPI003440B5D6
MSEPPAPGVFDELRPSALTPIRSGGTWAGMIVRCLEHEPRRFPEPRVPLRGITANRNESTARDHTPP